jgi:predicted nicotinamide N-methyase
MREEHIVVAGHELLIARPDDPESLIDEKRFGEDEFLPYWAELWPSGLALAHYAATRDLAGLRVLELGCGLALPSFAAALTGADVVATDWAPEALSLAARNAETNGLRLSTALVDWHAPPPPGISAFDVVLAADVLYEERNAVPLLRLLAAAISDRGTVLVADPGRRHATAFFERACADGWSIERVPANDLPSGCIAILQRTAPSDDSEILC